MLAFSFSEQTIIVIRVSWNADEAVPFCIANNVDTDIQKFRYLTDRQWLLIGLRAHMSRPMFEDIRSSFRLLQFGSHDGQVIGHGHIVGLQV